MRIRRSMSVCSCGWVARRRWAGRPAMAWHLASGENVLVADALFGVNSLRVAGGEYLLAVSTSAVVHLVTALPAGSGGQPAVDAYLFDDGVTGPSLSRRY